MKKINMLVQHDNASGHRAFIIQSRRDRLEASFTCDVDEEFQWLIEREPLAASQDLGTSLNSVQRLQKKHQALETVLMSREQVVNALVSRALHLSRTGHPDAHVIEERAQKLKGKLAEIRDSASVRKLRLQDALEAQIFYTEAGDADIWLRDKLPMLHSAEVGRDEVSSPVLLKKLEASSCEVDAFQVTINRIELLVDKMIERQHLVSDNVLH